MSKSSVRRWLRLAACTSGNTTLITAIAMPMLLGGAGLAVDTAQWYMWKRELQHSVDQAAVGGAWALVHPDLAASYKTRAMQEFTANQKVTAGFTSTPVITLASFGNGTDNSVLVSATASKTLPFSSFFLASAARITVRAQASFTEGSDYHACLIATADDGTGIDIGGNATVNARCGLAALSCDDDAVVIDGSAVLATDSIATCGKADVPEENRDVVTEGVSGLQDSYADLATPNNATPQTYSCKDSGSGSNKTKLATAKPGTYSGGFATKCTTVLDPGIYVIDGGSLDLTANYNVTGTGVMFVLKNGATIKFGGQGNNNKLILSPMLEADLAGTPYAADADRYAGMLVFEDRNNNPTQEHTFNGNSTSLIEGMMYFPSGDIRVLGTARVASQCLQITAHRIRIAGNAELETLCPTEETTSAGSSLGSVRLVA